LTRDKQAQHVEAVRLEEELETVVRSVAIDRQLTR
jgi:hypothetical protein